MKPSPSRPLDKPHFQIATAALVALAVVVLGYYVATSRAATGPASLSLSPASGTYTTGQAITVQVMVNTGGQPVNAVQADFTYPSSKLQFQSIDGAGSVMGIDASSTGGGGSVSIARGSTSPYTGTGLLATVRFTALASGSAALTFSASSAVVRSTDNTNIAGTMTGASYTLSVPATPTPTPTPTAAKTPTPKPTSAKTPTPSPGAKTPTPSPVTASTPTPVVAANSGHTPTPSAAPSSTPSASAVAVAPVTKVPARPSGLTLAAGIGIPALALLLGLSTWLGLRHRAGMPSVPVNPQLASTESAAVPAPLVTPPTQAPSETFYPNQDQGPKDPS
jgi:outer membrane biosynthesis protein TonB